MKKITITKLFILLSAFSLSIDCQAFISAPSLFIPSSNITMKRMDVSLTLKSVTNATGYQIEYDTVSTFDSKHLRRDWAVGTYPSIQTETLYKGKKYYWRARAFAAGDTSSWTSPWNFTVYTQYELQSPGDAISGPLRTLYGGSAGQDTNFVYLFELDTVSTFNSSSRIFKSQKERAFLDSSYFKFGKKFFWRATVVSPYNETLDWSDTRSYTIDPQPTLYKVSSQVDPQVVLSWANMEACEVILEIDTVSTFNSGMYIQKILEPRTLRDTLRNLPFGQQFYYRVRAKFDDQLSSWSTTYNFSVNSTSSYFSPANNGTVQNLVVSFSWSSMVGVRQQVQVARDSAFEQVIRDTILAGYTFYLPDTLSLNTEYFWRIKYMHETDTTDWINLSFKTYTGQVNAISPSYNATNLNARVTFIFYELAWADSYVIEIDTGKTWPSNPSQFRITATNFYDKFSYKQIDTLVPYNANIIWRVYAIRGTDTAEASYARSFTTKKQPTPKYPNNNYVGIGTQTNVQFELIAGSDSVIWELDTVASFNSPAFQTGNALHEEDDFFKNVVSVSLPGDLMFETKYYWRGRFVSAIDTSEWSIANNFTTTQKPWLNLPADKATGVSRLPKLTWGVQGSAEDYVYQYQIGTDINFNSTPIKSLKKGSSAEVIENVNYATKYYWRARALHSKDTSSWSLTWSFTTEAEPSLGKVFLGSPSNGQKNVGIPTVALIWYGLSGATTYDIQVATEFTMTDLVAQGNVQGTAVDFKGMKNNEKYFWRVRGVAGSIIGDWSNTWSFETVKNSSVELVDFDNQLIIFPNPASNVLNVAYNEAIYVDLVNVQGQSLYVSKVPQNSFEIDLSNMANGVYWLKISSGDAILTRKIIVAH